MTVTFKKQIEETTEIELPVFYKRGGVVFAMFHEDSFFKVSPTDRYGFLSMSSTELFSSEVAEVVNTWEPSNEQEFRVEYDKALRLLSLPKRQITTAELLEN